MLNDLDETMFHQVPQPFAVVGTSDHRFFDRYWFCGADPAGGPAFFAGLGRYPNMGTQDGFLSVLDGRTQHNLRVATQSEETNAPSTCGAGPLAVAVHEPYRRVALSLNAERMSAELEFRTDRLPHLERHHVEMGRNRVLQDQQRYVQVGGWSGWIEIDRTRYDVDDWWGDRDHAWGVRVDVGGLEPPEMSKRTGSLTVWCSFATRTRYGMFQLRRYADGRPDYLDGVLHGKDGAARVNAVEPEVTFAPGTSNYQHARILVRLEDGSTTEITAEPLTERAWAGRGGGYSRGFDDGRGFGARRGEVVEYDCYDVSEPDEVRCGGDIVPAGHREQLARLTVDGEPGIGHLPIMDRSGLLPG